MRLIAGKYSIVCKPSASWGSDVMPGHAQCALAADMHALWACVSYIPASEMVTGGYSSSSVSSGGDNISDNATTFRIHIF